mgnify:CR=1 FL=1
MSKITEKSISCGYHIEWYQDQYWIIGNDMNVACGNNENSAKFMLSSMTESPLVSWGLNEKKEK